MRTLLFWTVQLPALTLIAFVATPLTTHGSLDVPAPEHQDGLPNPEQPLLVRLSEATDVNNVPGGTPTVPARGSP